VPRALLVSDLHLAAERPDANEAFFEFLREQVPGAEELYILGDLFEAWTGDDELEAADGDALARAVVSALAGVAARGVAIRLMRGNRDFLMGDRFARAAGGTLLDDPHVADLAGARTLLLHGDTLCTDDAEYQAWRRTARSAAWQAEFLAQTLAARRARMRTLREQSRRAIQAKPAAIMDVNAATVAEAFRRHGVRRMIHGHTHRPARHEHVVDGSACERWVLPDWYGSGGYLVADALGLRMQRF